MKKYGQVEIMGLIVIVILITVVLFFILSFDLTRPIEPPPTLTFQQIEIKESLGITLIETTTLCNKKTIGELLADCAYTKEIDCGGTDSCTYANDTIEDLVSQVLDRTGANYSITVSPEDNSAILTNISKTGCNINTAKRHETIPTYWKTYLGSNTFGIQFDLNLCN